MNLLKNFGGGGTNLGGLGAAKPLGSKNNYFSSLKLQYNNYYLDRNNL